MVRAVLHHRSLAAQPAAPTGVWLIKLHPGWLAGRSVHPACKVEWEPGVEHTLQMTKASAQHDLDERMKLTAEEAADN